MKTTDIYKKNKDFPMRKFGKETVLVNVKDENIIYLNETSSKILSLIDGKNSVQNIADKFVEIYGIDFKTAFNDIKNILQILLFQNAIELNKSFL